MSTIVPHLGYHINKTRLRQCRLSVGLTQCELGRIAGYGDRLIRKAEGVGRISGQTLIDIAAALSSKGPTILPESLLLGDLNDVGGDTHEVAPGFHL